MTTTSAQIRARLDHPLIDGDSHIIEFTPVLMDYIKEAGGEDAVTDFANHMRGGRTGPGWYQMNWEERKDNRAIRGPWWALPTKNTLDRCTAMLPKLYHERMDDFGLDYAVLYPTTGLFFHGIADDAFRQLVCHAYNEYAAAAYAEYGDRMTVAAVVPLHTPGRGHPRTGARPRARAQGGDDPLLRPPAGAPRGAGVPGARERGVLAR